MKQNHFVLISIIPFGNMFINLKKKKVFFQITFFSKSENNIRKP